MRGAALTESAARAAWTLLVACLGSGLFPSESARCTAADIEVYSRGALTLTRCRPEEGAGGPLCGAVHVPENWSHPGTRSIDLHVVIVPALKPDPTAVPLFDLAGGPGLPDSVGAELYVTVLGMHRLHRDVVLMDQRGTGGSHALHCPAIERENPLAPPDPLTLARECRRTLEADADLTQYTTVAAARDIEAVRQAMNVRQFDLSGLSYGTMLAQVYMKMYPRSVRSAVLFGAVPLGEKIPLHHARNADTALRAVFADCRADPDCAAAFPDLDKDWHNLLKRLSAGPIAVSGARGALAVDRGPFLETLRTMMNTPDGQRSLPYLIHLAAAGDLRPFTQAVEAGGPELEAEGLYLSVICPEDTRRIGAAEVRRASKDTFLGEYRVRRQMRECAAWPDARPDKRVLEPLRSRIPVLIFAGGRDATTPVAWARRLLTGLPNGRLVEIEPMTHLPIGLSDMGCIDRIMVQFYARGSASDLDTRCVAGMKPMGFKLH